MRELLLMRHATAEWPLDGGSDFSRPLSTKGQNEASLMGLWLKQNTPSPQHIICSPSQRTVETLAQLRQHIAMTAGSIELNERAYLAELATLLHILSDAPPSSPILLLGHNNGVQDLLKYLCGSESFKQHQGEVMSPGTIAHIQLPDDWTQLTEKSGHLQTLISPRQAAL